MIEKVESGNAGITPLIQVSTSRPLLREMGVRHACYWGEGSVYVTHVIGWGVCVRHGGL
jgi:hypothetical protein